MTVRELVRELVKLENLDAKVLVFDGKLYDTEMTELLNITTGIHGEILLEGPIK